MTTAGKFMVLLGLIVVVFGLVMWGAGRIGFRGLPGDIRYESNGTRVYFPIVTSIVISIVLTLLLNLLLWLFRSR